MKSLPKAWQLPLRFKIVLLLFISSVLPLAILGAIAFYHARDSILSGTGALLTARGDEVEGKLDAFHVLYRRAGERVASLPDIVQYVRAPAASHGEMAPAVHRIFDVWLQGDANIRGFAMLDSTGTVTLGTEKPLIGRNLAAYRYVREALRGTPGVSDLHISGAETGSTPTIAYLIPIKDQRGQVAGIVVVWVRASAFWKILTEGNEKAGPKSFSVLFDQFGVRIGHSYSEDIVFHPGGRLDSATLETMVGERRFGDRTRQLLEAPRAFPAQFDLARASSPSREVFRGFAPVNQKWNIGVPRRSNSVPWTLFYMIPEESLDAPINALIIRMALLTVGAILFAILAGTLVSRGIVSSAKVVSEAAESLGTSSAEILSTTTQVATSAAEAATAVNQTTATVEEVKQTAQLASQKAKSVSESAQKASQVSQTGRKSVEEAIQGMHRIQEQMESIAESIVRLSEQSQAIGEIIAAVNDLAEQSNLLAVNAAIEATKAGEQGKGFAVVAQEIKNLAEQSKQAVAQVRAILTDVQKATSAAVLATEQGHKAVETGVKQSAEAGETIRLLADSIAEAAQAATQIAASSQQQMVGMDQVALAMENIKQTATQNATGTKQAEAAAQGLHALGQKLNELVARYI